EKYIGCPYVDVPNPFPDSDAKNYAEYFELEFENSLKKFGIQMEFRHQAQMYRSGKYKDYVLLALKKRGEIFDIIDSHRTQEAQEGERDSYYPVSIYCPECGRDTTKIESLSNDCTQATYTCKCGHKGSFDFTKDFNCKLAWKIDWPMRWRYEGVDFEPGGKDHASINGSYDTSKHISKQIFDYDAPIFQGYEFIGISDSNTTTGKMSGSTGLNLTPETLLKLYQPEVLLWLYSRNEPLKAFNFCLDDGILRQYFEFDKMYNDYKNGTANDLTKSIMELASVEGRNLDLVPMSLIVQLGSVVNFNLKMLEVVFEKIGTPFKYEEFKDRLERAKFWLEKCSPQDMNKLRKGRNWQVYDTLTDMEKEEISQLHDFLKKGDYDLAGLQTELYAIPKRIRNLTLEDKELKTCQGTFFKNVYKLLIDKERGPRLYLFLYAIDKNDYLSLLDFSYPKTEEETESEKVAEETVEETKPVYGDPDPVADIKDEIELSDFEKIDLRVCKIVKCQEIRKSHNCYKLTLFDGKDERVIVSSIKHYYTPEQLVGKKIIVVANLKPVRITGVTSNGMLVAATNNACGCQVVFVDDIVPEGTQIK
ncbi:MAG: lysine--tRNA ligase, partial [Clostridia bacterium]|nr:lysine--tRNA ligase [Clostridia bacterium]